MIYSKIKGVSNFFFSFLPIFLAVQCSKPAQVPNGRSSWTSEESPTYTKVINYSCDEGYTLSGNNSIVCSKTGEYNSQPPECKGTSFYSTFSSRPIRKKLTEFDKVLSNVTLLSMR